MMLKPDLFRVSVETVPTQISRAPLAGVQIAWPISRNGPVLYSLAHKSVLGVLALRKLVDTRGPLLGPLTRCRPMR
jgi:hypothetical protein